ncbi:murein L,D-transpeptidase YafK [Rhodoblastus acidophilus]|uniref:L,D-transpeptidase family protein n=1 Tax=Rhodoblastus acidophilus TaxID=1074 RepID=UPI002225A1C4|nr:L,D-transpeptidase family protein [Rhodoblastus acidophilus]MCW2282437.1 murein L,D-transpeptidase YafK [Rhodoblastus acidophilus]MCW2331158.1 murein L,D-transpeptidase YafK [Rhodoblastus acidophilus]
MSDKRFFRRTGGVFSHTSALLGVGLLGALSGCNSVGTDRSMQALSSETVALMAEKGVTPHSPMLIRAYKKESELEVWKMRPDGTYVHLKTFPICRWSGQLGPKRREGDRQSPEGFYTITPAQMNPNSAYYLSFNVGYPNAYDRAHGATGGAVMVHGVCSSAGCFSMTDRQIAEIYAMARESFAGGQRSIQMQALPFHLNPTNLAKFRLDPNMPFWKELKKGVDHFEATHHEVNVGVCGGHYVFGVKSAAGQPLDPEAPCPALAASEPDVEAQVAQRERSDEAQVAALVKQGERPIRLVYKDGGQHPTFANITEHEVGRADALTPPVEVALDGGQGVKARTAPLAVATKMAPDPSQAQPAQSQSIVAQTKPPASASTARHATAPAPVGKIGTAPKPPEKPTAAAKPLVEPKKVARAEPRSDDR